MRVRLACVRLCGVACRARAGAVAVAGAAGKFQRLLDEFLAKNPVGIVLVVAPPLALSAGVAGGDPALCHDCGH